MTIKVTGDLYEKLDGKLFEIKRQIRQHDGYPFDPKALDNFLQKAIEGNFSTVHTEGVKWFEKDGMIYFSVTLNGMSGKEWIKHFESKGIKIGDYARQILLKIKPGKKGTASQIAVIKGESFSDDKRSTSKIWEEADKRNLSKPNAEVACLIRDMFTDEEIKRMGLHWIIAMHKPKDLSNGFCWLGTYRGDDDSWMNTGYFVGPYGRWESKNGFAFVASQENK